MESNQPGNERPLRLGVLANQFFDRRFGAMGGFGWAASEVARCFNERPELGVEVVLIYGKHRASLGEGEARAHDSRLLLAQRDPRAQAWLVRGARIDVLLTIDYRPHYMATLDALPRTPMIVWVRDPRPKEDMDKVATLRIPGREGARPGVGFVDCTSLARTVRASGRFGRPVLFASPAPAMLLPKAAPTYGTPVERMALLPNPIEIPPARAERSGRPRVAFLGRLDPIKRPWIFVELARRFPGVTFDMLGDFSSKKERWTPSELPQNVRLLGHVAGEEKLRLLSSAWALVNTSVHESLPVSFLEALAGGTPIVSCQDPEGIVSRFGIYTGRWDGSGLDSLPHFGQALKRVLRDEEQRARLGEEGRAWVRATHGRERFLEAFFDLCATARVVPRPGTRPEKAAAGFGSAGDGPVVESGRVPA